MKRRLSVLAVVLFASTVFPCLCPAQRFQDPTKEELAMTSDPKAPNAPAVYLERADETDWGAYYVSHYARIKILTEEGKAWARVEIKYDAALLEPPIIEGRTIHPDGSVIPLPRPQPPKVDDAAAAKLQVAVFTLPDVTVGSILEYKWTLPIGIRAYPYFKHLITPHFWSPATLLAPRWLVQDELYTHTARFRYDPVGLDEKVDVATHNRIFSMHIDDERGTNLIHTDRLPPGVAVSQSVGGQYSLEVHDIPALPNEPDAPPTTSRDLMVQFFYAPYPLPDQYWDQEIKRWSNDLKADTEVTKRVREISDSLTSGTISPADKARRLYRAVQDIKNESFIPGAASPERRTWFQDQPKKPEQVWDQKGGTPVEIARLYLALCKAAGLDARGVAVVDRSRHIFDRNFMSLEQFDSLLVAISIAGQEIYTDPGEKLIPFGELYWGHTISTALDQRASAPVITPPVAFKNAITAHYADLVVNTTGNVAGTMQVVMDGRQLNLRSDEDEVKRQLIRSVKALLPAGLSSEITGVKGLERSEGYLQVTMKVSGPLGTMTGKRLMLPAFLLSAGTHAQFVSERKREMPVDLHYPEQVIDEAIYHLPSGYTLESAPQQAQLPWPDHAMLVVKVASSPNAIDIKRVFARAIVFLEPKEYSALHDYYQKLAQNDRQQVVLAPATTSAGN